MAKVFKIASPWERIALDTVAAIERSKPFVIGLFGVSGRVGSFAAASAREAEALAAEQLGADAELIGCVIRCGSAVVSRVA